MMKKGKRLLALFLTFVLSLSLLQLTAFAADGAETPAASITADAPVTEGAPELPDEAVPVPEASPEALPRAPAPEESAPAEPVPSEKAEPEAALPTGPVPVQPVPEVPEALPQDQLTADAGIALASEVSEPVTVTQNLIKYTLFPDGTAEVITGSKANKGKIVIPAAVTHEGIEYQVTSIASNAFSKSQYTTASLTLPEGLLSIGESAFAYVFLRGTVQIPNSVTSLGAKAFYECDLGMGDITAIIVGDGVETIPSKVFYSAWGAPTPITLGAGVGAVASDAFAPGTVSSITVNAIDGSLDDVLAGVPAFAGVRVTYTKEDPSLLTSATLQELIDAAPEGENAVIALSGDVKFKSTVVIPAGKDITLTDDGQARILKGGSFPMFRIEQGGTLTIAATGGDELLTLRGGTVGGDNTSSLATIHGSLLLKGGTLQGGSLTGGNLCAALLVREGGQLTMTGGILENTTLGTQANLSAAVVVGGGARFDMSGGSIRSNVSKAKMKHSGAGVTLYTWSESTPFASMTLSGDAEITGNTAENWGGGVYMTGNVDFRMTGGRITDNTAGDRGGGICVAGLNGGLDDDYDVPCNFTMDGGVISGNRVTHGSGGGIYVNSNGVTLNAGTIESNTASNHGGGVYVSVSPYTLHLSRALITGNTATTMGGGIWFCPTGSAGVHVTDGAAVFGNTAAGGTDGSAADDFAFLDSYLFPDEKFVSAAGRILGGGQVEWYNDGKIFEPKSSGSGLVDQTEPRYDPAAPGEPVTVVRNKLSYALKAVVSPEAQALAESQATLFITGNTASRGGGLGSNGAAQLGVEGEEWTLQVTKLWAENVSEADRRSVTVRLKIGDTLLDSLELGEENGWTGKFTDLPDPGSLRGAAITVQEDVPGGFEATYGELTADEANRLLSISITNEKRPTPPPTPSTTSLTVTKRWEGDSEEARPENVTVNLLRDGEVYDSAVLTAGENWTHTWRGLSARYDWSVEESEVPEGYRAQVVRSGRSWTITNTYVPEEVKDPEIKDPEDKDPEEDELHEDPTPLGGDPIGEEGEELTDQNPPLAEVPETGDALPFWLILALLSAFGLVLLCFTEKRRSR